MISEGKVDPAAVGRAFIDALFAPGQVVCATRIERVIAAVRSIPAGREELVPRRALRVACGEIVIAPREHISGDFFVGQDFDLIVDGERWAIGDAETGELVALDLHLERDVPVKVVTTAHPRPR